MLIETHPLYKAQMMLAVWFEKAPKDHLIEFQAPICDGDPRTGKMPPTMVEACRVKNFENAFDNVISQWIQRMNAEKRQVFYSVCPRAQLRQSDAGRWKTGQKEDVTHAVGAWVDLDTDRWKRQLELDKPQTTFVVETGNGAHLYFRYEDARPIKQGVEDSKRLAAKHGGDDCFNQNRLLRVPGTKNWKKWWDGNPKGRACSLYTANVERTFAGTVEGEGESHGGDVWNLDHVLRDPIVNGHENAQPPIMPDGMTKDDVDRSQIDMRVMIRLFLKGWDEDAIRAVFTNEEYGISAKYFDEGGNGDHYLTTSIRTAAAKSDAQKSQRMDVGATIIFETPMQLAKTPKLQFAVEKILPSGGMLIVSGPAKVGKSLIVTDLILCLAGAKGKFLDAFNVLCPGRVAYCQAEISRSSLRYRFDTIGASRDMVWETLPLRLYTGRFDLSQTSHVKALAAGLKQSNCQYLVVDPLARFHSRNENSSGEMAAVLSNLEYAAHEGGCIGIILVHHHGKPSTDGGREGVNKMRGASVIGDWGNAHLILNKRFSDSTGRKYVQATFELRDADEPDPITLQLNKETLRFGQFSEQEERIAITIGVLEATGDDTSSKELVADVKERFETTKSEAERLIAKSRAQMEKRKKLAEKAAAKGSSTGEGASDGVQASQPVSDVADSSEGPS